MTTTIDRDAINAQSTPLDEMRDFLALFIDASDTQLDAICLWICHTHVLEAFVATPRLLITSKDPGCGKSETLRRIRDLAANGWSASRATKFSLTAKLDCPKESKPTLVVDEVSQIFGKSGRNGAQHPLAGVLLNGYKAGEIESMSANRTAVEIDIFAAVALAGRGNAVPDDVRDRAVAIMLRPGRPRADYLVREHDPQSQLHSRAVARYFRQRMGEIRDYSAKDVHPKLSGRKREIWEPLFAIARSARGTWPQRCLQAFLDLVMDESDNQVLTPKQTAIRDILRAAQQAGSEEIAGRDIIAHLRGLGQPLYDGMRDKALAMFIAAALEPCQPSVLSRSANDGRQLRGYYLADIELIAEMRLPAEQPSDEPEPDDDDDDVTIFDMDDYDATCDA